MEGRKDRRMDIDGWMEGRQNRLKEGTKKERKDG